MRTPNRPEVTTALARKAVPPRAGPQVMGIVNVTPDSFSDGGCFFDTEAAAEHARVLIDAGADLLDVGGESTRPHAEPVAEAEEIARTAPVLARIRQLSGVPLSIDTMKPATARAAVAAGASIWNDVTALTWSPDSPAVAAELGCTVILMHVQGRPQTMQDNPRYEDVVAEVSAYLLARAEAAMAAGVRREAIWIDPGIGFGKTVAHNLALLAHLDRITALGFPVLLGVSRKGFLGRLAGGDHGPADRLASSLAAALVGARAGVSMLRVHDVHETRQALSVQAAIEAAGQ